MGLFGKSSSPGKSTKGKDSSGSPGKPGRGYGKGSASTNSDKWNARTPAQKARAERAVDNWKG